MPFLQSWGFFLFLGGGEGCVCMVFSLSFIPDKNKRLNGFVLVLDSLFHRCCTDNYFLIKGGLILWHCILEC